jgi:hypothetical protein
VDRERGRLAGSYAKALEELAIAAEARGDLATGAGWWKERAAHDSYDSRVAPASCRPRIARGRIVGLGAQRLCSRSWGWPRSCHRSAPDRGKGLPARQVKRWWAAGTEHRSAPLREPEPGPGEEYFSDGQVRIAPVSASSARPPALKQPRVVRIFPLASRGRSISGENRWSR